MGLVEIFRAVPIIVLIVWMFYAFPAISGVRLPAFESALVSISIVSSAFVAEVIRAAIEAIPKGQIEAAKVLGMNNIQILQVIVLPQAFMRNLPALVGEYTSIIKNTSLAVIIGVNELLHSANNAAVLSYRPMELYTALGIIFILIILPISLASKRLEYRHLVKS